MNSNGREYPETSEAYTAGSSADEAGKVQTHFVESADNVTIDSGTASWTFDALHGGRLTRWQWRTLPPIEALNPATRHNVPRPFELVDSKHGMLVDHFFPLGTTYQEVAAGTQREFGDFVDTPYTSDVADLGGETRIMMVRDGAISAGKRVAQVQVIKSAGVRSGSSDLSVLYRVINSSLRPVQILFALEYNLFAPGLAEDAAAEGMYLIDGIYPDDPSLTSVGMSIVATSLTVANRGGEMALQLGWDRECDLWRMPGSEAGPDSLGGAVRILAVWRLSVAPQDNWALGLWLAPG